MFISLEPRTVPIQNYGVGRGPIILVFCFRGVSSFNECLSSSETTRYGHNDDVAILCPRKFQRKKCYFYNFLNLYCHSMQ